MRYRLIKRREEALKRRSVARARLDRFRRPLPFSKARSYGNWRRTTGLPGSELNTLDLAPSQRKSHAGGTLRTAAQVFSQGEERAPTARFLNRLPGRARSVRPLANYKLLQSTRAREGGRDRAATSGDGHQPSPRIDVLTPA